MDWSRYVATCTRGGVVGVDAQTADLPEISQSTFLEGPIRFRSLTFYHYSHLELAMHPTDQIRAFLHWRINRNAYSTRYIYNVGYLYNANALTLDFSYNGQSWHVSRTQFACFALSAVLNFTDAFQTKFKHGSEQLHTSIMWHPDIDMFGRSLKTKPLSVITLRPGFPGWVSVWSSEFVKLVLQNTNVWMNLTFSRWVLLQGGLMSLLKADDLSRTYYWACSVGSRRSISHTLLSLLRGKQTIYLIHIPS